MLSTHWCIVCTRDMGVGSVSACLRVSVSVCVNVLLSLKFSTSAASTLHVGQPILIDYHAPAKTHVATSASTCRGSLWLASARHIQTKYDSMWLYAVCELYV